MSESQAAIDALENLGLTEYEARCFVALAQLPHGTAKEISQVADIPRSRVYETMDRLRDEGLVELHEAEPRMYQSVSIETAVQLLREEYESYFDTVEQTLQQIEPAYKKATQGVWALNTHEQVSGRVMDIVADATDEIVLLVLDDLLNEETLEALAEADERGVPIYVGTVAEPIQERVEDAGIDTTVFTTELVEWFTAVSDSPRLGRLLTVDRNPILVSALHQEELPGVPNETAVWTDGIDHGFATFAERVLTYELTENTTTESDETE
ncbi:TrmB family transcriptional regulator [Halomontanus rarus]|uniref:TrmB family transcriptional regulator n=1 Tax=Halomontanus rarus TaxID=3034020 RepID=UPI0023E7AF44|nr:helix-turn-helix domain-containing protein [Halovivax sp. TS33]